MHFDLNLHRFAAADAGYRGGENVVALLLEQHGLATLRGRLLIDRGGFLFGLDLAFNSAFADHQPQGVNGGVFRQREDINGFRLEFARITENLGDFGAGDNAGDIDLNDLAQHRRGLKAGGGAQQMSVFVFGLPGGGRAGEGEGQDEGQGEGENDCCGFLNGCRHSSTSDAFCALHCRPKGAGRPTATGRPKGAGRLAEV